MRRGRRNGHGRKGCTGRWHVVCGLPLSSDRRLGCCYFRLLLSAPFRLAAEPKLFVLLSEHPCLRLLTGYPDALHALSVLLPRLLTASSLLFTATAAHADGFVLAPPSRDGLQAKWLEKLRIVLQDEADALQYFGELAPGGPPSRTPTPCWPAPAR